MGRFRFAKTVGYQRRIQGEVRAQGVGCRDTQTKDLGISSLPGGGVTRLQQEARNGKSTRSAFGTACIWQRTQRPESQGDRDHVGL